MAYTSLYKNLTWIMNNPQTIMKVYHMVVHNDTIETCACIIYNNKKTIAKVASYYLTYPSKIFKRGDRFN